MSDRDFTKYGASANGNFSVVDTIGVPHPYCIGSKHVVHASKHFSGMLGKAAIEDGERRGIFCDICKGELKFSEHEQALLVACKAALKAADGAANPELHAWLLSIKDVVMADGFAGFAFVDRTQTRGGEAR